MIYIKAQINKNEKIFYFINSLFYAHMGFMGATYILFFYSIGFSKLVTNFIICIALFTTFIVEIPTGAYSDVFGKRKSFLMSGLLLVISMLVFLFNSNLYIFLVAEVLLGVSYAFVSGALESWVIETLNLKDNEIVEVFSKNSKYINATLIIGGILGGFASKFNFRYIWLLGLISSLIYLVTIFIFIKEEEIRTNNSLTKNFTEGIKAIKHVSKTSIKYGLFNKNIRKIVIYNVLLTFSFAPLFIFWSPLMQEYSKFGVEILGIIWLFIKLANMLGNSLVLKITKLLKVSRARLIYLLTFCISLTILLASLSNSFYIIFIAFILFEIVLGILQPIQRSWLNEEIKTDSRATILSFESMINSLSYYISILVMGYIADSSNIKTTWLIVSVVMLTVSLINLSADLVNNSRKSIIQMKN